MPEPRRLANRSLAVFAAALGALLLAALAAGMGADLGAQGRRILDLAWGRILLLDVYAGLLLFACWILWRERGRAPAALWIVALLALGNVVACLYVLVALRAAGSDPDRFWHGVPRGVPGRGAPTPR